MKLKLSIIALPALVVTALFLAQATTTAAEGEETDGHPAPAVADGDRGAGRLLELLRTVPLPDGARDALRQVIHGAGFSGQGPGHNAPSNGHGPRALCQQFAGSGDAPEPIAERCHRPARDGDGVSLAELCRRAANADDAPERLIERCERLGGDHDRDRASLAELCRRAANADDAPERLIERCERLSGGHDGPHPCDRASDAVDDTTASIVRRCHDAPGQQRPAFDGEGADRRPRPLRPAGVTPAPVDPAVN